MISSNSTIQWLADQVGADWLHMSAPTLFSSAKTEFVITMRFGQEYCRVHLAYEKSYLSKKWDKSSNMILADLLSSRDEFFLLSMHKISLSEGVDLEGGKSAHGM